MTELLPPPEAPPSSPRTLAQLWAETIVVLLMCVVPLIFQSVGYGLIGQPKTPFTYQASYLIIRGVGAIALVWFLIVRSGEPLTRFGLARPNVRELVLGLVLFLASYVAIYAGWFIIYIITGPERTAELSHQDLSGLTGPQGGWAFLACLLMSVVNGAAEELTMRAYLIPRFEQLFSSTTLAILLTTLLFASYHSYQGSGGLITIAIVGLYFGGAFCLFRSFWPIALAHILQDAFAYLVYVSRA